ncbi:MAG: hypothetical protein PHY09_16420 [Desulfuromonadaceae bacterium]|nr:hypothetical protein [Desulfuromonadaceae bacterium]MDD5106432.1 hypothetical protein [Desulfuromonadaceae bacterium]
MAHVGQEDAFGTVGSLRLILGHLQLDCAFLDQFLEVFPMTVQDHNNYGHEEDNKARGVGDPQRQLLYRRLVDDGAFRRQPRCRDAEPGELPVVEEEGFSGPAMHRYRLRALTAKYPQRHLRRHTSLLDAADDAPPHGTLTDREVPVCEDGARRGRRNELDDALAADPLAPLCMHVGHDDYRRVGRQCPDGRKSRVHVRILRELGRDLRREHRHALGSRGTVGAITGVVRHAGEDDAFRLRRKLQQQLLRAGHVGVLCHPGYAPLGAH